ncbi:MAG: prepilin-type N-terminal cleavage/methylation domain-containing protein [Candidatus Omnitrophica bacterium]|nr:prepilin-type N-terminal cleavage/methylation domain-containing protein [Candidatus Omnitrophota bacterium]
MNDKAVTLIELLISLVILGLVMVGFSSLDLFSSRQVVAANKILKTQNDAAYITEFIVKETMKAVGDFASPPVRMISVGGETGIAFKIDVNENGRWDSPPDKEVAFVYRGAPDYEMRYYSDFSGVPGSYAAISRNAYMVPQFGPVITDDYLTMEIATCWDPQNAKTSDACGSPNNPVSRVRSRILIPAASVH